MPTHTTVHAAIEAALCAAPAALHVPGPATASWSRASGNALASAWTLEVGTTRLFVKIADARDIEALSAEAEGLQALADSGVIRVPQVVACGRVEGAAFLAMEWLAIISGGRDAALGRALAALHAVTATRFGWHRDNTIGATTQSNTWDDDWARFFRDRRIAPQLALAATNGYTGRLQRDGERLLVALPALLEGHRPAASLLHGDLWSGNAGRLVDGAPVIFDPSVHYGDREADLAMTELFGGFRSDFYAAYREAAPLPPGHALRRTLYNLYHVLNHLNLFGAAYRPQAESMIGELLASAR